jgi:hypothetical protein
MESTIMRRTTSWRPRRSGAAPAARPRRRPLNLERLEDRTCPQAVTPSGPTTLNPGDRVQIAVTITTAQDPNENGEGETLDVQINGPHLASPYVISDGSYNTTKTYTYLAFTNETITASFSGGDGDEDGSVTVTPDTQTPRFNNAEKNTFNQLGDAYSRLSNSFWRYSAVAGVGSAVSGAAAALSAIPTFGVGAAIFTGTAVGLAGNCAYFAFQATYASDMAIEYYALARDPFDPNFATVAQPVVQPIYFIPLNPALAPAVPSFQALSNNEATEVALLKALGTAANRANSAQQAGDAASEALQVQAIATFKQQLASTLAARPALLAATQPFAQAFAGSTNPTASSSDIQSFESNIQQNGLPAIDRQVLAMSGATPSDIQAITQLLFVQDTAAAAGNPITKITDPALLLQSQGLISAISGAPQIFAVGADAGGGPQVNVYNPDGSLKLSFFAYDPSVTSGVRVAVGDVNGDGVPDIITAPGPGGGPNVRVFDGKTGAMIQSFFAFDPSVTTGLYVAAADVNGDGKADIIAGAGPGAGPAVSVFSGADDSLLTAFFAYDPAFTGGVTVAAGDVNGDGLPEIVTGPAGFGGPNIKVFSPVGAVLQSFFAYDPAFVGGLTVAVADLNGDGQADIITGAGAGGGPNVKVFSGADDSVLASFFAYDPTFTGGVRVGVADVDGSGDAALVLAAGPSGGPAVTVEKLNAAAALQTFFAFDPAFTGGIYVG